ncbi:serine/threonine-protein kinase [Ktedonospora formicarum]|uniref:Protein kinase domain-containing protein n=1 Tax=Ktedonospora formicarum TaxID=2778364 RepID=A0A8J3MUQ0_9CHLR|nr:serine/threonine-protein kinase [Ktedonospora formicarum]GHO45635.1 hypothetical protein KSX_37980 [Ktedonospora formicarum]
MSQRDTRLIGGVYRTGQILNNGSRITTCTAYNRNTNDVVGLYVIHNLPAIPAPHLKQLLQPLTQRRAVSSPHLLRVHDWGMDGDKIFIATDPPRGVTLRHAMDNENVDLHRAVDFICQLAFGVKVLHEAHMTSLDLRPQLVTVETLIGNTQITDRVQLDDIGLRILLQSIDSGNTPQPVDELAALDLRYASLNTLIISLLVPGAISTS